MLSTHRKVTRIAGLLVVASFVFAACSSGGSSTAPTAGASTRPGCLDPGIGRRIGSRLQAAAANMDALIAAAKAEGGLNTIALPRDWCNYGAAHRRLHRQVRDPDQRAQPRRRLEGRARSDQGQQDQPRPAGAGRRRRRPVLSARRASTEGLFQPYKVATWDSIPDTAKDADGMWYGDYYGVMSFEVNTKVVTNVPKDWADLLKPDYKNMVALAGDPTASNQATSAVWALGLLRRRRRSTTPSRASTSSRSSTTRGNFVPVIGNATTVASGETPIRLGVDLQRPGRQGFAQGQSARSRSSSRRPAASVACTSRPSASTRPHPNAAKLWMEYLYSDEGQNAG